MKRTFIILALLTLTALAFGQYRDNSDGPSLQSRFVQPQSGLFNGLFNNPNLDMSQSYSMSFASSSGGSVMQGMYLNNMRYRLSGNMLLNLNMGMLHQPYSTYSGSPGGADNAQFIGGAELLYKPSENVLLSIGFNNIPYYYSGRNYSGSLYNYPYNAFSNPWQSPTPGVPQGDNPVEIKMGN